MKTVIVVRHGEKKQPYPIAHPYSSYEAKCRVSLITRMYVYTVQARYIHTYIQQKTVECLQLAYETTIIH